MAITGKISPSYLGQTGSTGVYKLSLATTGLSTIQSIAIRDDNFVSGGTGAASGFDLDFIRLSTVNTTSASTASTAAAQPYFDFISGVTFQRGFEQAWTSGDAVDWNRSYLFGTDPAGNYISSIATLGTRDGSNSTEAGSISLGEGGYIIFRLTQPVSTTGLFLYFGDSGGGNDANYVVLSDQPTQPADPGLTVTGTTGGDDLRLGTGFNLTLGMGDDTISGSGGNDLIDGGPGNDVLFGNAGLDTIAGSAGNDRLIGGAGADILNGGDGGYDVASYEDATVGVYLNLNNIALNTGDAAGDKYSGIDSFVGSNLLDEFIGSNLADDFWGNYGGDILRGNGGNDVLRGGWGNDLLEGGSGADYLDGGGDTDVASYANAASGLRASLASPAVNTGDAAGDTYLDVEGLTGSAFGDDLIGNGLANYLHGLQGADVLWGQGGNDELYGEDGDDWLIGGTGADKLDGGNGLDTARYSYAAAGVRADLQDWWGNSGDALGDSYYNIEALVGSDWNDLLLGNNSANQLWGDYGNDSLWGRGGDDQLAGGNGLDTFFFTTGWGRDTILDYKVGGAEKLNFTGVAGLTGFAQLGLADSANGLTVTFGTDSIFLAGIHTLAAGDCVFI